MVLYLLSSTASLNDVLHAQICLTHKMSGLSLLSIELAVACEFTHEWTEKEVLQILQTFISAN